MLVPEPISSDVLLDHSRAAEEVAGVCEVEWVRDLSDQLDGTILTVGQLSGIERSSGLSFRGSSHSWNAEFDGVCLIPNPPSMTQEEIANFSAHAISVLRDAGIEFADSFFQDVAALNEGSVTAHCE